MRAVTSGLSGCDIAGLAGVWIGAATGLANQFAAANGIPLLVAMFVGASDRQQGVGAKLVDAAISWARYCGAEHLALWVASNK